MNKQLFKIDELRRAEALKLPEDLPYERYNVFYSADTKCSIKHCRMKSISAECREKLTLVKPTTVHYTSGCVPLVSF